MPCINVVVSTLTSSQSLLSWKDNPQMCCIIAILSLADVYISYRLHIVVVNEGICWIFDNADNNNIFSLTSVARSTCCIFASQKISTIGMAVYACAACVDDDNVSGTTISPIRFPNSMFISFWVSKTTFSVSVAKAIAWITGRVHDGLSATLVFAAFPRKVVNSLFPVGKKCIMVAVKDG